MAKMTKRETKLAAIRGKEVEERTTQDYSEIIKYSTDGLAEYITMCPPAEASDAAREAYKAALFDALNPQTNTVAGMEKIITSFVSAVNKSGFESKAIAALVDGVKYVMVQNPEIFAEGSEVTTKMEALLESAEAAGKIIVGRDTVKLKETVAELKEARATIKRLTEKKNDPDASELTAEEAKRLATLESFARSFVATAYKSTTGEEMSPNAVIDDEILGAAIEHYTHVAETASIYAGLQEKFPGVDFKQALNAYKNLSDVEQQNGEVVANQLSADQMATIHRVFGTNATLESVINGYNDYKNQVEAFNLAFGGQTVESVAHQYNLLQRQYDDINGLLATSTVEEVLDAMENYNQIVEAKEDAEAKFARSERDRKIWKGVAVGAGAAFVATALALAISSCAPKAASNENYAPEASDPAAIVYVLDSLNLSSDTLAPVVVADAGVSRAAKTEYKVGWASDDKFDIRLSDAGVEKYNAHAEDSKVEYTDFASTESASDFIVAYAQEYSPADVILTANQISPELLQNEGGVVTWTTGDIQLSSTGMQKYNDYIKLIAESGDVTSAEAIASIGAVEVSDFVKANDAKAFASVEYFAYQSAAIKALQSQIDELKENDKVSVAAIDALFVELKAKYNGLNATVDESGKTVVDFVTTDENGDEKVVTITLSSAGAAKVEEASQDYVATSAFQNKDDALEAVKYIIENGVKDYDRLKDLLDEATKGNSNTNTNVSSGDFSNSSTAQDVAAGENTNKNPSPKPGFKDDDKEPYRE